MNFSGLAAAYPGMLQAQSDQDINDLNALRLLSARRQMQEQEQMFPLQLAQARANIAATGRAYQGGGGRGGRGLSDDVYLGQAMKDAWERSTMPGATTAAMPQPQPPETSSVPSAVPIQHQMPLQPPPGLAGTGFGQIIGTPVPPPQPPPVVPQPPPGGPLPPAGTGFGDIVQASLSARGPGVPPTVPASAGPGVAPPPQPGPATSTTFPPALAAIYQALKEHGAPYSAYSEAADKFYKKTGRGGPSAAVDARVAKELNEDREVKNIVSGVKEGLIPPDIKGYYHLKGKILSEAKEQGINLTQKMTDWNKLQRAITTMNGPQMTKFAGAINRMPQTIEEVKTLANEMKLQGIPLLNKFELMKDLNIDANSPQGLLATRYITAVNTLREDFLGVVTGGYAPTEAAWAQVNRQINENYGNEQMIASLDEITRLVGYVKNAVPNLGTLGPGSPNQYIPGSSERAPAAPTAPSTGSPGIIPAVTREQAIEELKRRGVL